MRWRKEEEGVDKGAAGWRRRRRIDGAHIRTRYVLFYYGTHYVPCVPCTLKRILPGGHNVNS